MKIITWLTKIRLGLVLYFKNIKLDKIKNKSHGFTRFEYIYLNCSDCKAEIIIEAMEMYTRVTFFINCRGKTKNFVWSNPEQFDVIKVQFG
uniref:Uncharacterized protein n=1 Tax=viral metagenome TaxID=1070528 RepID=A0A6C0AEI3_9ZZZZ